MATTIFTLPQGNYGPVTDFKSPSYTPPVGTSEIIVTTSIAPADLADSTKNMSITYETSFDGGHTFQPQVTATWQGGQLDKFGNPNTISPVFGFDTDGTDGLPSRLSITANKQINMGATVATQ